MACQTLNFKVQKRKIFFEKGDHFSEIFQEKIFGKDKHFFGKQKFLIKNVKKNFIFQMIAMRKKLNRATALKIIFL